jgi:hypothetical protein
MGHLIEPATSARAKCRGCAERIAAGDLRFGEVLPNPFAEGEMTQWYHLECAAYRRPEPLLETLQARTAPLEGSEGLLAAAEFSVAHRRLPRLSGAERASSGRAQCRSCRTPIAKGDWRISLVFYEEGQFQAGGFIHVRCAKPYFETTDVVPRLRRFSPGLTGSDLEEIEAELAKSQEAPQGSTTSNPG